MSVQLIVDSQIFIDNSMQNQWQKVYVNSDTAEIKLVKLILANQDDYVAYYTVSVAAYNDIQNMAEFEAPKQVFRPDTEIFEHEAKDIGLCFALQGKQVLLVKCHNEQDNLLADLKISVNLFADV